MAQTAISKLFSDKLAASMAIFFTSVVIPKFRLRVDKKEEEDEQAGEWKRKTKKRGRREEGGGGGKEDKTEVVEVEDEEEWMCFHAL